MSAAGSDPYLFGIGGFLVDFAFADISVGFVIHIRKSAADSLAATPSSGFALPPLPAMAWHVVHFCAVLLVAAILSAPWPAVFGAAVALAGCGVAGAIYVVIVISHTRRQTLYRPVLEDWLFHCVFPLIAYTTLVAAAVALPRIPTESLFAIGAVSLLLLFSGIHNAWDAVVYIAITSRDTPDSQP